MTALIGAIGINLLAWVALACAARWQGSASPVPAGTGAARGAAVPIRQDGHS